MIISVFIQKSLLVLSLLASHINGNKIRSIGKSCVGKVQLSIGKDQCLIPQLSTNCEITCQVFHIQTRHHQRLCMYQGEKGAMERYFFFNFYYSFKWQFAECI